MTEQRKMCFFCFSPTWWTNCTLDKSFHVLHVLPALAPWYSLYFGLTCAILFTSYMDILFALALWLLCVTCLVLWFSCLHILCFVIVCYLYFSACVHTIPLQRMQRNVKSSRLRKLRWFFAIDFPSTMIVFFSELAKTHKYVAINSSITLPLK